MKNEWKGGECRRRNPSPREVRELCHNVQSCLFTFAMIRVSLASGPSQKSFLQTVDPYHGLIFVSSEVQLWLFGGLEPLQRGMVSFFVWFPVRSCEGEFFCLLVVFTGLWFRQLKHGQVSWSPFLCANVTCLLGLFLCASRWGNASELKGSFPFHAWLSHLGICLILK